MHSRAPPYLSSQFEQSRLSKKSSHITRAVVRNDLRVPHFRLEKGRNTFLSRGASLWNTIPMSVRLINDICTFKTAIKHFLMTNYQNKPAHFRDLCIIVIMA